MSTESVMPSNHLILCHPLLLLPSIFPSIRVFPNESALRIRWPKYCSFSFSISPSDEYSGLISGAKPDLYNCTTCLQGAAPSSQSLNSQVQARARSTPGNRTHTQQVLASTTPQGVSRLPGPRSLRLRVRPPYSPHRPPYSPHQPPT